MENLRSADELNELSGIILNCSLAVHKELGPGLLESVYQQCMVAEIGSRGLRVEQLVPVKLHYKGEPLKKDFIVDTLVEQEIVLEIKSVDLLLKVHEAQLITYLKLTNKRLGLLINFNVPLIKNGFKRFVNKL